MEIASEEKHSPLFELVLHFFFLILREVISCYALSSSSQRGSMCSEHFTLGVSTLQTLLWPLKLAKISNMRVLHEQARESCQHWGLVLDLVLGQA